MPACLCRKYAAQAHTHTLPLSLFDSRVHVRTAKAHCVRLEPREPLSLSHRKAAGVRARLVWARTAKCDALFVGGMGPHCLKRAPSPLLPPVAFSTADLTTVDNAVATTPDADANTTAADAVDSATKIGHRHPLSVPVAPRSSTLASPPSSSSPSSSLPSQPPPPPPWTLAGHDFRFRAALISLDRLASELRVRAATGSCDSSLSFYVLLAHRLCARTLLDVVVLQVPVVVVGSPVLESDVRCIINE